MRAWIIVSILVLLSVGTALAEDPGTEDGRPIRLPLEINQDTQPPTEPAFSDSADASSLQVSSFSGPASPGVEQATAEPKAGALRAASVILAGFDLATRMNAMIQLEPLNSAAEASTATAAEVSALWNSGEVELALAKLEQLEALGGSFAIGITWREPIPSQQVEYYADVRIGSPNTDAEDVALDYHRPTGNIFALVSWGAGNTSGTGVWTLNMSSNGGTTWVETFVWTSALFNGTLVDMAVVDDHVYVGYVYPNGSAASQARLRRNSAIDGSEDAAYGFHTVSDVTPATVTDISVATDADQWDDRIYLAYIDSNNDLGYFWDESSDGKSFVDVSPTTVSPSSGLDAHYNKNGDPYLFLSYHGTDGAIHVLKRFAAGVWDDDVVQASFTGTVPRTRVSSFGNNVFVAYEHEYTYGYGAKYAVSYDGGGSWNSGTLFAPASGEPAGWRPDISARSGIGSAAVWNREEGSVDQAYHIQRPGYAQGVWTYPFPFSNFDLVSGSNNYIEWIGSLCVSSHAVVYLGEGYLPYFDLISPRAFFCDGFESGNTSAW